MFNKRSFFVIFSSILILSFVLAQVSAFVQAPVAHAQAATPSFPDMTQLSPDGQHVIYVTAQNLGMVGSAIHLVNADGTQDTVLVAGNANNSTIWVTSPVWSPDSQQVAYMKVVEETVMTNFTDSRFEIWAIGINGSNNRLLENTLFHPSVGYGGKVDLVWNASNEIEFFDGTASPPKQYALNVTTLAVHEIGGGPVTESIPTQATIDDVPLYWKNDPLWRSDPMVDDDTDCSLTLGQAGSAVTAAAMTVAYAWADGTNPSDVNTEMGFNDGYDSNCNLRFPTVASVYNLQVDTSLNWRPNNQPAGPWRANVLNAMKREVAAGVPAIVWYWSNYPTSQNFLVVTAFSGASGLTANDPSSGASVTRDFYLAGYPIEGIITLKEGGYFSKIGPADGAQNVNPVNLTLDWNTYLPVPGGYRYCVHTAAQKSCDDPTNTDWTNAGTSTHATRQLQGNTTYNWQVQANIGAGPSGKVNANNGEVWIFTTGNAPTPTRTPTPTPVPVSIGGNIGLDPSTGSTVNYTITGNPNVYTASLGSHGNYSFTVPSGSSGNVTPSNACYTFSPPSSAYTNVTSHLSFNFTATQKQFSISGSTGLDSTLISYWDDNGGPTATVTANASGHYNIPGLPCGWSGTVSPSFSGVSFSPANMHFDNLQANATQNFQPQVRISGNAGGMGGVVMHFDGETANDASGTSAAGPLGNYSIPVPYNWSGDVTPVLDNVEFTPISNHYDNVTANTGGWNYTAVFTSIAADDGWILQNTSINSTGNLFRVGDDISNHPFRAILSFDTSALPNDATITSATLKIKQYSVPVGDNPFLASDWLWAYIRTDFFGTSSALELADFSATGYSAGAFNETPDANGWYSNVLTSTGISYINKVGLTQFRLHFGSNGTPDSQSDYINFYSGNFTTFHPQLIITYTVP